MNTISFPGLGLELNFPDGFDIGSLHIYFYGVVIAVGLLLAMWYAFAHFRKVGVDSDKAIDAILGGVVGGIVGARLYYVIFKWENYQGDFWKILNIRDGGLAIYGGLIGALLVGILIAKWRRIHIPALLDIVGVGFLLGQGIGRWGNFFNVEAFGDNTTLPWGMTGPRVVSYLTAHQAELAAVGVTVDPSQPVHPTFLYESIWCLVGFLLLAAYLKHRKFDGEVFLFYLGFYGLERAVVEGLRTDSLMIGTLRVSQLLAALLFIASLVVWLVIRSRIRGSHDENYMKLYVLTDEGQRILKGLPDEEEEARKKAKQEAKAAKKAKKAADVPSAAKELPGESGEDSPEPDGKADQAAPEAEAPAEEEETDKKEDDGNGGTDH